MQFSTRKLCFAAMFLALGLILPQAFHLVGGRAASSVLSPMHLPVFICGLLLGWPYGLAVGFCTPLLSSLLTGMPPSAILPFMLVELTLYGVVSGIFREKKILALLLAQIIGRIGYACALFVAGTLFGVACAAPVSVLTSIWTGLPGIALQWLLVPMLVTLLQKTLYFSPTATVDHN